MSISIRGDLLEFSLLKREWKETKLVQNLSIRIRSIRDEDIRSYAAATFCSYPAIFAQAKGELLQIVQEIDPVLHTAISAGIPDCEVLSELKEIKDSLDPVDPVKMNTLLHRAKSFDNAYLRAKAISKIAYLQEDESLLHEITSPSMKAYAFHKIRQNKDVDCCERISETIAGVVFGIPIGIGIAIYAAALTSLGIFASLLSCITAGTKKEINEFASEYTENAKFLVAYPYRMLWSIQMPKESKDERENTGYVTKNVAVPIFQKALHAAKESDFLQRHLLSRGLFLIAGLVSLVSRAVDFSFGVAVGAVSLFPCLLLSRRINTIAFVHLKSLGVIYDITAAIRGAINPQQFLKS